MRSSTITFQGVLLEMTHTKKKGGKSKKVTPNKLTPSNTDAPNTQQDDVIVATGAKKKRGGTKKDKSNKGGKTEVAKKTVVKRNKRGQTKVANKTVVTVKEKIGAKRRSARGK